MPRQTYQGGCHCGAVRYEAALDLSETITCNCSYCSKRASVLAFTARDQFTLLSGEGALREYRFNKNVIQHLFCEKCGVESYALGVGPDGVAMAAVNVRCLDGVDAEGLPSMRYNGKDA
ncbi:MAG: GFA family protein [Hyphomonadaceae bacterium]